MVVSSTDGYCSVITFAENELGVVYKNDKDQQTNSCNEEVKTSNTNSKEKLDTKTKKELPLDITLQKGSDDNMILGETEDANMDSSLINRKDEIVESNNKEVTTNKTLPPNQLEKPVEVKPVSESAGTAMEVDDFQLVYEATLTEPVLEKKDVQVTSETNHSEQSTKISLSQEKITESQKDPSEMSLESPVKNNDTVKIQQAASPISPSTSAINVTPGNSNKKTPRRVQLITLSSPKSKKKLLQ